MKFIIDKKEKNGFNYHLKNSLRNITIVLSYTIGFALYSFVFLICREKSISDIDLYWIFTPILGFVLGLIHLLYVYKGSLFSRGFTMISIMIYVFAIPFIILFI